MRRLIVDAGSTKTEWVLLDQQGETLEHVVGAGFNPNYNDIQLLTRQLDTLPAVFATADEVYYYGSGCNSLQNQELVALQLRGYCEHVQHLSVAHDLMAVCHALLGHDKGIACILGTGSNSCLYDGEKVVERGVSLGYLLGDEGSGCHIGKKLVRAYFYDLMPLELRLQFDNTYNLDVNTLIQHVYQDEAPSRYLAAFTKFAGERQSHPFIRQLVKECFHDFIQVFVLRYDSCRTLPINFVGSVAFHFQSLLQESLADHGLRLGKVIQSPMEGLELFFRSQKSEVRSQKSEVRSQKSEVRSKKQEARSKK
ncbi:MAG: hypothetical protein K6A28_00245 [Bacteroidales bacterium]|nr:hypothetical protein [Bacteroidales bacterium]